MAGEYADLAALRESLRLDPADTSQDSMLTRALSAASRGIDRTTGRRFWLDTGPVARVYNPRGRTVCDDDGETLLTDDIGSLTGLVVETGSAGTWTATADFEPVPDNALLDGRPVTGLLRDSGTWGLSYGARSRVRVTARFGWPQIPDDIEQATLIQASRLYKRKDSPEGVMGSAEWGVVRLSRRDPDVWALIEPFVLPGFG